MIRRADEQAIELPEDFWTAIPIFVTDDEAAIDAMWSRVIEEAAKRKGI